MEKKTNIEKIPMPVLWVMLVFFIALLCFTAYGMFTDSGEVHKPNYYFMSGDEPVLPEK
jgi:hypothetical protein